MGLPTCVTAVWSICLDAELAKSWIPEKIKRLSDLALSSVPCSGVTRPGTR